jgi:hypothetical protein
MKNEEEEEEKSQKREGKFIIFHLKYVICAVPVVYSNIAWRFTMMIETTVSRVIENKRKNLPLHLVVSIIDFIGLSAIYHSANAISGLFGFFATFTLLVLSALLWVESDFDDTKHKHERQVVFSLSQQTTTCAVIVHEEEQKKSAVNSSNIYNIENHR